MKRTAQEIIDMGSFFWDSGCFTRTDIWNWLTKLIADGADFDIDRMFDLIVG